MMRVDVPTGDRIVRYVKPHMIQEDGTVDGSDFRLRSTRPDESGLSVNCPAVFGREVAEQLDTLRVVHDPLEATERFDADPSHAEIKRL